MVAAAVKEGDGSSPDVVKLRSMARPTTVITRTAGASIISPVPPLSWWSGSAERKDSTTRVDRRLAPRSVCRPETCPRVEGYESLSSY